jgi:hypothetical protein
LWASIERKKTGRAQEEQCNFDLFNFFEKRLELIRSKEVLPEFEFFQIKYGFEDFEIRNNFPY